MMNNNVGQLEEDNSKVENRLVESNDDINNKEIFDREMRKLNQQFNEINDHSTFNRHSWKIIEFRIR